MKEKKSWKESVAFYLHKKNVVSESQRENYNFAIFLWLFKRDEKRTKLAICLFISSKKRKKKVNNTVYQFLY